MPFLMALFSGKKSASLMWAVIAAIVTIASVLLLLPLIISPSKVTLATRAADAQCNTDKLSLANNALAASLIAEQKASHALRIRLAERSKDEIELSARVEKLKAENDALKEARTDDGTRVFEPDDGWLQRSAKARSANDPRAKAR